MRCLGAERTPLFLPLKISSVKSIFLTNFIFREIYKTDEIASNNAAYMTSYKVLQMADEIQVTHKQKFIFPENYDFYRITKPKKCKFSEKF